MTNSYIIIHRTDQCHGTSSWETFNIRQKLGLFVSQSILTLIKLKYFMSQDLGTSKTWYKYSCTVNNPHLVIYLILNITTYKEAFWVWNKKSSAKIKPDITKLDYDSDKIEIRLPCCWTLTTFWNISSGYLTQTFNSWTLRVDL